MSNWFDLADRGVRVVHVPVLEERWLYLVEQRLLLVADGLSSGEAVAARSEVLEELRPTE